MLTDQQIRELFALMARSKPTASRNIQTLYLARLGSGVLDYLLDLYPREPKAGVRYGYVYSAIPYAKDDMRAVQLARLALSDRAASVRYWGIALFAATLDTQYTAVLKQHALDSPEDSGAVSKAIEAINKADQSLFISSGHPAEGIATVQWDTAKPDTNRHLDKARFKVDVEEFIEKYSPEVVADLHRILGPLYN